MSALYREKRKSCSFCNARSGRSRPVVNDEVELSSECYSSIQSRADPSQSCSARSWYPLSAQGNEAVFHFRFSKTNSGAVRKFLSHAQISISKSFSNKQYIRPRDCPSGLMQYAPSQSNHDEGNRGQGTARLDLVEKFEGIAGYDTLANWFDLIK